MFPWSALLSLAGQGLSTGLSVANNKRAKEEQEAEYARQQAHYNAKANENPLARSENQQVLNQYDRKAQQQVENARNVAKITGATPEYSLAVQKGVAQGRSDLMGDIAAGASKQRDKYEDMAETSRQNQAAAQQAYRQQRNEQFANLAANAASTFGSIVDSYAGDSGVGAKKAPAANKEQNAEKKAQALGVVTNTQAPKSDRYQAAAQTTDNPYEQNAYQQAGAAAKQHEQLATGAAATSATPASGDPEPDPNDFLAHSQWVMRQNIPSYYRK